MIRIYHNDRQAIISDEYQKIYWYSTIEDARIIAKTFETIQHYYSDLSIQSNYLVTVGYSLRKD